MVPTTTGAPTTDPTTAPTTTTRLPYEVTISLKVYKITKSSLYVSWTLMDPLNEVSYFLVGYNRTTTTITTATTTVAPIPTWIRLPNSIRHHSLGDLSPDTAYTVCVSAYIELTDSRETSHESAGAGDPNTPMHTSCLLRRTTPPQPISPLDPSSNKTTLEILLAVLFALLLIGVVVSVVMIRRLRRNNNNYLNKGIQMNTVNGQLPNSPPYNNGSSNNNNQAYDSTNEVETSRPESLVRYTGNPLSQPNTLGESQHVVNNRAPSTSTTKLVSYIARVVIQRSVLLLLLFLLHSLHINAL